MENGEITGTYETFVDSGVEIPERITDLTGITAEMTAGSPQLREAVEGFLEFSGDAVLLGHNLPFDYGFMKRNVVKLGGEYERHGLDTLAIAKSVLSDLPGRGAQSGGGALRDRSGAPSPGPGRCDYGRPYLFVHGGRIRGAAAGTV